MGRTDELARDLAAVLGVVAIDGLRRLSGGASRETWAFEATVEDGSRRRLILRRDPPGPARTGMGPRMGMEAKLLAAAAKAGVPVPEIVVTSDDPAVLGSAFLVMTHVEGETIPRRILRDDAYAGARPLLAGQCGTVLAALHRIPADAVPELVAEDQVEQFRTMLDSLGEPHPTFELAFRWLEQNRPEPSPPVVVHGDFRNGNIMVGPDGVRAVLDWELAHLGDPLEDLGWLCVKAWRFGVAKPVGGFGEYGELIDAYEAAGGRTVDRDVLHWWETLGTLKWGIMCIMQAFTHTTGAVRSVELAAIGRRVCEQEWDLLALLP
jgi:aminoglycoside phosphotransferase (APT) family kinase protein